MATGTGMYILGGLLILVGLAMMLWRVTLGFLTGTGSFWIGFLLLAGGVAVIALGVAQGRRTPGTREV